MGLQPDFPFKKGDSKGYFSILPDERTIQGRLIQLLVTAPGERPYLCDYGVGLKKYLFEPLDDMTLRTLRSRITSQFGRYEPGLLIRDLNLQVMTYGPPATLKISVTLEIKLTKERKVLSFPIGV